MEATIHIKQASNGLIVTTILGTGLTSQETINLYLDYMSMQRGVVDMLQGFKP